LCVPFKIMRTNIHLNEKLVGKAMKRSHARSKPEVIEWAFDNYVKYLHRLKMLRMFGKVEWEGDLNELRSVRFGR
jgi:Arc/MetJ family transcription regulator